MVHSGVCSKAQGEQGINLQLSQGLQSQLRSLWKLSACKLVTFLKRTDFITRKMRRSVCLSKKSHRFFFDLNGKLKFGMAMWKFKTEHESKLTLNSIPGYLYEKVKVCLLQARLHNLTYSSNFKVPETGVVIFLLSIVCPPHYANSAWKFISDSHLIYPSHYPCLRDWHLLPGVWWVVLGLGARSPGVCSWGCYLG